MIKTYLLSPILTLCLSLTGFAQTQIGQGCGMDLNVSPASSGIVNVEICGIPSGGLPFLAIGFSDADWRGTPLPLDLSSLGMPSCSLWISLDAITALPQISGCLNLGIAVSGAPASFPIFIQAYSTAPGANALGVIVSGGASLR